MSPRRVGVAVGISAAPVTRRLYGRWIQEQRGERPVWQTEGRPKRWRLSPTVGAQRPTRVDRQADLVRERDGQHEARHVRG